MAETSTSTAIDAEWRQISKYLWVGRRDGHPIGMIEHGSHFVATADDDTVLGRFGDLASAQAAFAAPRPPEATALEAIRRRRVWPYVTGGAVLAMAAAATSAGALLLR